MLFLILSVGRNPAVLRERQSILTAAGYVVTSAYDKEQAMEKLIEGDFDLVLLCPSLGKDVWHLAHAVRRHRPSIPVVSITPNQDAIMRDCGAHITGPKADEIVAVLHEVLGKEQQRFLAKRIANARQHVTRFITKARP